jgi:uncharacterized RDD family membrane protein YckC
LIDPFGNPSRFEGLLWRRAAAYVVDLGILLLLLALYYMALAILSVATLGLLTPLLILVGSVIPAAYHTLTIGGPASATVGMRVFKVQVRTWAGGKPGYLQALLHTVVFYLSLSLTSGLILLWPLFSNRRRCLHDLLCGTVVVRNILSLPETR